MLNHSLGFFLFRNKYLFCPFYRWGHWDSEYLNDSPQASAFIEMFTAVSWVDRCYFLKILTSWYLELPKARVLSLPLAPPGWALFHGIHVHLLREGVRKWLTESMGEEKKTRPGPCACVREVKPSPALGLGLQSWSWVLVPLHLTWGTRW